MSDTGPERVNDQRLFLKWNSPRMKSVGNWFSAQGKDFAALC